MYNLLFLFIVLIGAVDFRIPLGSYWDEAVVFIVILLWIYKVLTKDDRISPYVFPCIGVILGLICLGLLGNVLHPGYQESVVAILKDILAFIKFPVVMILAPELIKPTEKDKKMIVKSAKVLVVVAAFFAVVGYFVDIGMYITDWSRILKSFQFIYQHCTFFVSAYVMVLVALVNDSIRKNRGYILLCCGLLLITQRTKAYLVILLTLAIMIVGKEVVAKLFSMRPKKVKIKGKYIAVALIAVVLVIWFIGKDKIAYYFGYGLTAARPAMYIVGIYLLFDFFPIGSGFGTFASFLSGEYYSKIYYQYKLSTVLGMRPTEYNYMGDVFWPWIYGQLGIIGLIGYVYLIVVFFKVQLKRVCNSNQLMAFLLIWAYALFASTAEAYFTNSTAMQMALGLALFIGRDENVRE